MWVSTFEVKGTAVEVVDSFVAEFDRGWSSLRIKPYCKVSPWLPFELAKNTLLYLFYKLVWFLCTIFSSFSMIWFLFEG
jgi:hypothetical protein